MGYIAKEISRLTGKPYLECTRITKKTARKKLFYLVSAKNSAEKNKVIREIKFRVVVLRPPKRNSVIRKKLLDTRREVV